MVVVCLNVLDPRIIRPHHCVDRLVRPVAKGVGGIVEIDHVPQADEGGGDIGNAKKHQVGQFVHGVLQHRPAVKFRFRSSDKAKLLDKWLHGAGLHDSNVPRHGGCGVDLNYLSMEWRTVENAKKYRLALIGQLRYPCCTSISHI